MIEDYAKHAAVWDWDGYDNTAEYEYWCDYARKFGDRVLLPMCALGQTGAYMAQKGFRVTAFDITREMIGEGKKRFGGVKNLSLKVADICHLDLAERDFDFGFLATQDLHLLSDIGMVREAFISLSNHLRKGGCLVLELILPSSKSHEYPEQTYDPRVPNYTDRKVWKVGKGRYDAVTRRHYIDQTVYIQDEKGIETFDYAVVLQYFERREILRALNDAGFTVIGEYCDRKKTAWTSESREWMIEAVKAGGTE